MSAPQFALAENPIARDVSRAACKSGPKHIREFPSNLFNRDHALHPYPLPPLLRLWRLLVLAAKAIRAIIDLPLHGHVLELWAL